jgi:hypothetical protein
VNLALRLRGRVLAGGIVGAIVVAAAVTPVLAGAGGGGSLQSNRSLHSEKQAAEGADEIVGGALSFNVSRVAPGSTVSAGAFTAAFQAGRALPLAGGSWSQVTSQPYDSDAFNYRDPNISNSGGGSGLVSGRMTGLAVDPHNPALVYAGAADGGVWKSTDSGAHWTPLFDDQPSTAIGAVAINPADGSVWVGTGENNTAFDNYTGTGIYRSTDGGRSWQQVGGDEVANLTVGKIAFDGVGGVYAATDRGLFKHSSAGTSGAWADVLDAPKQGFQAIPYGLSFVNDVAVQPNTGGQVVVASMAWRNGAPYNGIYVSRDGGATFARSPLGGAINPKAVGRASLAYSADGSKLYTVIEDTVLFNKPNIQTANTVLMGVYVSNTGNADGPWSQIADYRKLANSGSALKLSKGYSPGVQAWYNQFITVDPADANHVYLGLEEVFETRNGGSTWNTIGPYWNFGFACWAQNPDSCPKTTHSDQHAVAIGGGNVYVGNDGGVWSRSLSQPSGSVTGWHDLNATLHTLQYYYAASGSVPAQFGHGAGTAVWGGMQDNGVSAIFPGLANMVSPFGGDGGDNIVDPQNADRVVSEYTDNDMWSTINGGYSPGGANLAWKEITPSCGAFLYTPNPCDPFPRFIAPFTADPQNRNHWVTGGAYVWDNGGKGWGTSCSATACDWHIVDDLGGSGGSVSALAVDGNVTYAGWCGPQNACNPSTLSTTGDGFTSGIRTNYGGTWHSASTTGLPNRYVNSLVIDPANPAHVYAVFGGFSRRWVPNAGVGHVFESSDGGATWTDVSGTLPDAPADDLVIAHGTLVLATDVGVFSTSAASPGTWSRFGSALPSAAVVDLSTMPDGSILAATHGRGLWKIAAP